MRYLVSLNYAELTDSNYPKLNLASYDPRAVQLLWFILAAAGCTALLFLARRRAETNNLTIHAVAFCMLLLLQPFTQMGDLVVLLGLSLLVLPFFERTGICRYGYAPFYV
jgi:hypothetical protein